MRCELAREYLNTAEEPSESMLEELFAHVDSCLSCQALEGSQAAPAPLSQLSPARMAGFADQVMARVQEPSPCADASAVLEAVDLVAESHLEEPAELAEPAADELERCFAHVDGCSPCQETLSEDRPEAPLKAYSDSRRMPAVLASSSGDAFADRVQACLQSRQALDATDASQLGSGQVLESVFAHVDDCAACQAHELSHALPMLSDYAHSRQAPSFDGFYQGVQARLSEQAVASSTDHRHGAVSVNPFALNVALKRAMQSGSVSGLLLAMAASLLVAVSLWYALNPDEAINTDDIAGQGPSKALGSKSGSFEFEELKGWKPGIEWVNLDSDTRRQRDDSAESFSNEATLPGQVPGQGVEYSLPRSRLEPRSKKAGKKADKKSGDRKTPSRKRVDLGLSF